MGAQEATRKVAEAEVAVGQGDVHSSRASAAPTWAGG